MVKKKNTDNTGLINRLKTNAKDRGTSLKVKELPSVLLKFEEVKQLELTFIDEIDAPDGLSKVKIERLKLSGKITREGVQRIKTLFSNTDIRISGSRI